MVQKLQGFYCLHYVQNHSGGPVDQSFEYQQNYYSGDNPLELTWCFIFFTCNIQQVTLTYRIWGIHGKIFFIKSSPLILICIPNISQPVENDMHVL